MPENDAKKQFLSLIRSFATEKHQGERRIVGFKKRIDELRSGLESANAELAEAKSLKETSERDLRGYEVQLSMSEASIQAIEARVSLIHEEISVSASNLEALKSEERALRDEFINKMYGLNADIRKFQEETAQAFSEGDCIGTSTKDGQEVARSQASEANIISIEKKMAEIITETSCAEKECQEAQSVHKQAQEELATLQRKLFLMESIMKESIALQELTRQTAQCEEMCTSLGEELQRRCVCPSCHLDNVEALGGILQAGDGA